MQSETGTITLRVKRQGGRWGILQTFVWDEAARGRANATYAKVRARAEQCRDRWASNYQQFAGAQFRLDETEGADKAPDTLDEPSRPLDFVHPASAVNRDGNGRCWPKLTTISRESARYMFQED